ncbi:MAG: hypothetical protein A4E38_00024 [Methanoregulaceae archaeon PtaB.Bin108]|nr:MAG: hypothetical protein A4E38_00024 [Methanoregulaceae archaeon PtaB.Bin108]
MTCTLSEPTLPEPERRISHLQVNKSMITRVLLNRPGIPSLWYHYQDITPLVPGLWTNPLRRLLQGESSSIPTLRELPFSSMAVRLPQRPHMSQTGSRKEYIPSRLRKRPFHSLLRVGRSGLMGVRSLRFISVVVPRWFVASPSIRQNGRALSSLSTGRVQFSRFHQKSILKGWLHSFQFLTARGGILTPSRHVLKMVQKY